jgi:undecaprenyl diphosphate synthase
VVAVSLAFENLVDPDSPEGRLLAQVDPARLPRHIAVIMDGNGRWAKSQGLPRVEGHKAGADSVKEIIENCARLGVEMLTLYAFSVENWKRPKDEVDLLMELLKQYIRKNLHTLMENDIRFRAIGRIGGLARSVQMMIRQAEKKTAGNRGLQLNLALNYGGRTELVDAARRLAAEVQAGTLDLEAIDADAVAERLYTAGFPDPDLLIRTSGESRVSNFLLWQIAYTEFHITPVLWPDFRRPHLLEAVLDYQRRERRFGGL